MNAKGLVAILCTSAQILLRISLTPLTVLQIASYKFVIPNVILRNIWILVLEF